jgi:hypothetical protein
MYIKMYIFFSFYFNAVTKTYWFKNVVLSFTDLDKRKLRSDWLRSGVRRPPRVLPTTRVRSLCPQLRKYTFLTANYP